MIAFLQSAIDDALDRQDVFTAIWLYTILRLEVEAHAAFLRRETTWTFSGKWTACHWTAAND